MKAFASFVLIFFWYQCALAQVTLLKDINPGLDSGGPTQLTALPDGYLLFVGNTNLEGQELWRTDGTDLGTYLVKDINFGTGDSYPINPGGYAPIGNGEYMFRANNGINGYEPWKTDGTLAGTTLVKDCNPGPDNGVSLGIDSQFEVVTSDGLHYCAAITPTEGLELHITDGTFAGTNLLADYYPGSIGANIKYITPYANGVLMSANDGSTGNELVFANSNGINLVQDINPGIAGSFPKLFQTIGDNVLFVANDGVNGEELWRFDGTPGGAELVKDINPGISGCNINGFVLMEGALYFVADHDMYGSELWRTDGTEAGTYLVKDINPGNEDAFQNFFTPELFRFGNRLFFSAEDASGNTKLWTSDGTPNGTVIFKDINPGNFSNPADFEQLGNHFYFRAYTDLNGYELWVSNGTPAGTYMLEDIYPGTAGSFPSLLTEFDGQLLFKAETAAVGIELMKYNPSDICQGFNFDFNSAFPVAIGDSIQASNGCGAITGTNYGCIANPGEEAWFAFQAPEDGHVVIETSGLEPIQSGFNMAITLFDEVGGIHSCVNDNGNLGNEILEANDLVPGDNYFFMIQGFAGQPGTFNLTLQNPECAIEMVATGNSGECDVFTGQYDQELVISYAFPPSTGSISVNGALFPISGSPQTVLLENLFANSEVVDVEVEFTDDSGCAMVFPAAYVELPSCYCPADLNGDQVVNSSDLLNFLSYFGCTVDCLYDFDGNGEVETADLLVMLSQIGIICP